MVNIAKELMTKWESEQIPRWEWDTFKEMISNTLRFALYPSRLPELIYLGEKFKEHCKTIREYVPNNVEVGALIYIDTETGRLLLGQLQEGTSYTIKLNPDKLVSKNYVCIGRIHRHPDTGFSDEYDHHKFIMGEGKMWMSTGSDSGGDLLGLLANEQLIEMVVYKNFVGLAIKTEKTSRDLSSTLPFLIGFFKRITSKTRNFREAYKKINETFGIEFFYTTDFEEEPLERLDLE